MFAAGAGRPVFERQLGWSLGAMALLLLPFLLATTVNIDEFDLLYNGVRQLHGQVIYRDFFEFIPPVSEGLAALLFLVTGPSVLAARLAQAVLLLLAGASLYALGRRLGLSPKAACLPGPLFAVALFRVFPAYNHHWLSLSLSFLAIWALDRALLSQQQRFAIGAGIAAGFTLMTTQTDGALLCGVLAVGLIASDLRVANVRRLGGLLAVGASMPVFLVFGYLMAHGALWQAYQSVVIWPRLHYKTAGGFNDVSLGADLRTQLETIRSESHTPFGLARFYYLVALLATWPVSLLTAAREGQRVWRPVAQANEKPNDRAVVTMIAALTLGQIATALLGRADVAHAAMYDLPALLLSCVAAQRWFEGHRGQQEDGMRWLPFIGLFAFGVAALLLTVNMVMHRPADWLALSGPDQRFAEVPIMQFIRTHTAPGDEIVSLPWGGLHYFYGRPAASRYTQLLPPILLYNTVHEYRSMQQELLSRRPKMLILQLNGGPELIPTVFPDFPPAGYHLVAHLKTPMFLSFLDAYCFERQ